MTRATSGTSQKRLRRAALAATDAAAVATKAAHLAKADLATYMVTEMTALAGTMGRHYALKEGQDAGGRLSHPLCHGGEHDNYVTKMTALARALSGGTTRSRRGRTQVRGLVIP